MFYILFILSFNFILTTLLFKFILIIPVFRQGLGGGLNPNLIIPEMLVVFLIAMILVIIDRSIRKFFRIPFYMLFVPLYGLVLMLMIKAINPTLEPLEIMPGRLLFFGLYFILLGSYPLVENYLKHKFSRDEKKQLIRLLFFISQTRTPRVLF